MGNTILMINTLMAVPTKPNITISPQREGRGAILDIYVLLFIYCSQSGFLITKLIPFGDRY